jgi:hypothetical protein
MNTGAIVDNMQEVDRRLNDLYMMMEMAEERGAQMYGEGSTMDYLGMMARTAKSVLEEILAKTDETYEAIITVHEYVRSHTKPLPEGTRVHFPGAETTEA